MIHREAIKSLQGVDIQLQSRPSYSLTLCRLRWPATYNNQKQIHTATKKSHCLDKSIYLLIVIISWKWLWREEVMLLHKHTRKQPEVRRMESRIWIHLWLRTKRTESAGFFRLVGCDGSLFTLSCLRYLLRLESGLLTLACVLARRQSVRAGCKHAMY